MQRDAGRFADRAPWYGGDKIEDFDDPTDAGACSSGFSATDLAGGTAYVITAGHCSGGAGSGGLSDHSVYNIKDDDSIHALMGSPTRRSYLSGGNVDAEAIKVASSGGYVWSSTRNSTDTRDVTAVVGTNDVGNTVCTDGQRTGETCGNLITQTDDCEESDDLVETCDLVVLNNGNEICAEGDSGGPVYTATSSGAHAHGMIVGGSHYNDYYQCYYTPINDITDKLNLSITLS